MTTNTLPPGLRCAKTLVAQGISTLEDLAACSEDELLGLKGIGPAALEQIRAALAEHEFKLSGTPVEPLEETTVHGATLRAIESMPQSVQRHPFAALALRLAGSIDDEMVAARSKELRETINALHSMHGASQPAAPGGDEGATGPTSPPASPVDEIAARRRAAPGA